MFICLDCGKIFDEPRYWKETHGLDHGPYENFSGCPNCGGAYTDAYCHYCGEPIDIDGYEEFNGEIYCGYCLEIIDSEDE